MTFPDQHSKSNCFLSRRFDFLEDLGLVIETFCGPAPLYDRMAEVFIPLG